MRFGEQEFSGRLAIALVPGFEGDYLGHLQPVAVRTGDSQLFEKPHRRYEPFAAAGLFPDAALGCHIRGDPLPGFLSRLFGGGRARGGGVFCLWLWYWLWYRYW